MKNKDNLHFKWDKALSYNKSWNFVIGERESGKSVDSWLKIWSAYHYNKQPTIVLRRLISDITPTYIDDIASLLNKFLERPVQLLYIKGDVKTGIVDIRLGEADIEYSWQTVKKLPVFVRMIGLSNPMSRIKSMMLPNIKFIFFDEFICNLRGNEKYLKDEYFSIQEIYTTYNRESVKPIRILAAGNPYSVYCPLFMKLKVNTNLLKPGAFIVGDNYVIDCFQVSNELKMKILESNSMYQFDDAYKRYAFSGESINDTNIKICKQEPANFKLKYVFKIDRDFLSVHERKTGMPSSIAEKFWVCKHKSDWLMKVSNKRKILVFNFGDMIDGSMLMSIDESRRFANLRIAMGKRDIRYNCAEAQYMMEDIYCVIR